jgi:DNA-binding NarL/FixJ family response regulator
MHYRKRLGEGDCCPIYSQKAIMNHSSSKAASVDAKPEALRVCIVEDDARLRSLFRDWIESMENFCCVGTYGNGPSAVAGLPGDRPQIVLMDINLPGFTGIECVRRLKDGMPNTQFVMLTVYEDSEHIFSALEAGAVGYLLKRSTREELSEALKEVQAGGSPMTSIIARKVVQAFRKPQNSELDQLSSREREVLELLARGYFCKEIADSLQVRLNTVYTYIRRVYEKLHVRSRMEAVAKLPAAMNSK